MSQSDCDTNRQFKKCLNAPSVYDESCDPLLMGELQSTILIASSLTSCITNFLERILPDRHYYIAENNNMFRRFQAGF